MTPRKLPCGRRRGHPRAARAPARPCDRRPQALDRNRLMTLQLVVAESEDDVDEPLGGMFLEEVPRVRDDVVGSAVSARDALLEDLLEESCDVLVLGECGYERSLEM